MTELSCNSFKPDLHLIKKFESELSKFPQIEIKEKNYFSDGIYAREITIPAGVIVIGKKHKTQHLNFLTKGKIVVLTENGMEELTAPLTLVSEEGIKRVGLSIEETIWITVHPNADNCRDTNEIELRVIDDSELSRDALAIKETMQCLG